MGAGVPFVLCEAISTYAASGSRSEKGTVKGKVWVMDGIIINGRIRVVTGKEYVGKAPSAESNKIWVTVSSLQKYGI